jgi:hypothetical protein
MTLRRLFKLMIALTVTAGLLSMPFAAPSFAKPHAAIAGDMQAMPLDMPCCPDEGKAGDCPSCPLMALCMLSISIPLPAGASGLVTRDLLREAFSPRDDAWVQGLAGRPPDHPPRSNV